MTSLSRRRLIIGATAGTAVTAGAAVGLREAGSADSAASPASPASDTVPFHGAHQAGITTPPQRHALFIAFDLTTPSRAVVRELLDDWTATAAALTQGGQLPPPRRPRPGGRPDTGIARGLNPSRLTITCGFGPSLFDKRFGLAPARPAALRPLPSFPGDQLVEQHSHGDVLLQLCADDQQILSHAFLQLRSVSVGRAKLRWSQTGFLSPQADGTAPRNLLGLPDGTANATDLDRTVWCGPDTPAWQQGGTFLVFRKIRLRLPQWSLTAADEQDAVIGRRMEDGSPLSAPAGSGPVRDADLQARTEDGRPAIRPDAHIRLMRPFSLFRRGYNYDYGFDPLRATDTHAHGAGGPAGAEQAEGGQHDGPGSGKEHGGHDAYDAGLLFTAFTVDPLTQFVPAQRILSERDALRRFLQTTASGLYAVPAGLQPGQAYGHGLV